MRNFKKPLYILRDENKKDEDSNHFLGFEWSQIRPNIILSFSKRSVRTIYGKIYGFIYREMLTFGNCKAKDLKI